MKKFVFLNEFVDFLILTLLKFRNVILTQTTLAKYFEKKVISYNAGVIFKFSALKILYLYVKHKISTTWCKMKFVKIQKVDEPKQKKGQHI